MAFLYFFLLYSIIHSIKISPNDYKEIDNPYEDDIIYSREKFHHIISSFSSAGYIDFYKGIYYKKYLCCNWGWTQYGYLTCKNSFKYHTIENYTLLNNINDTNLKELLHYGCSPTEEDSQQNILFDYERFTNESVVSIQIRMTNIDPEPLEFTLDTCSVFEALGGTENRRCKTFENIDTYTIPNNSFIIYTLKLENETYWIQSDNFTVKHNQVKFNFATQIILYFNPIDEKKKLYINSYIVSVNLQKNIRSLSGHAHNYCRNYGCLGKYTCLTGANVLYGCIIQSWSAYITECSLFGCIPGSYCSKDLVCQSCDDQCRTCNTNDMNCLSCYSNAIYPQWKNYRDPSYEAGQCIFEFYPINKVESLDIPVPIPLSYRMTFEFWIYIHDPTYLTNSVLRPSLSTIILKEFFSFSLHQNAYDYNSCIFILTPFELFYPFKDAYITEEDFYDKYLKFISRFTIFKN